MKRPLPNEYPSFYKNYVDNVKTDNIIKELRDQVIDIQAIISHIPEEKEDFAYAPGKWTIKHAERLLSLLSIAVPLSSP